VVSSADALLVSPPSESTTIDRSPGGAPEKTPRPAPTASYRAVSPFASSELIAAPTVARSVVRPATTTGVSPKATSATLVPGGSASTNPSAACLAPARGAPFIEPDTSTTSATWSSAAGSRVVDAGRASPPSVTVNASAGRSRPARPGGAVTVIETVG
jgi:hypothetical protein